MSQNRRNGYILRPNQTDDFVDPSWKGTWKFGLFDCCSEPALCFSTLPCTCYYCHHQKVLDFVSNSSNNNNNDTNHTEPQSCSCDFCSAVLDLWSLCCYSACSMSGASDQLRSRYFFGDAAGDATTACCKFWLCKPCAMTQLLRELRYRGDDDDGGVTNDNSSGGGVRAPNPPRIYNLNPAEIQIEIANYKNSLPQANEQCGSNAALLENAILAKIEYLTSAAAVSAAGGPEEVISKQMHRLDPMVMFAAMAQPVDPQRYHMYTEMKNLFRQVQEAQEGQWRSDQRSRYEGMEREMSRPRVQVAVSDPNQVMMVAMQMGMTQQQQQQQQSQLQMPQPMMPPPQQPYVPGSYSPSQCQ